MLITPKQVEEEKKFENQYFPLYMQGNSTMHLGSVSKALRLSCLLSVILVILGIPITPRVLLSPPLLIFLPLDSIFHLSFSSCSPSFWRHLNFLLIARLYAFPSLCLECFPCLDLPNTFPYSLQRSLSFSLPPRGPSQLSVCDIESLLYSKVLLAHSTKTTTSKLKT